MLTPEDELDELHREMGRLRREFRRHDDCQRDRIVFPAERAVRRKQIVARLEVLETELQRYTRETGAA
jgi:hypothetical protein